MTKHSPICKYYGKKVQIFMKHAAVTCSSKLRALRSTTIKKGPEESFNQKNDSSMRKMKTWVALQAHRKSHTLLIWVTTNPSSAESNK